jgi:ribokinase
MVSLSDGLNGAYLYFNKELWHQSIYPNNSSLIESAGAGDAFSATFTSALALGKNTLEAFSWSLINPMSVIQKIGPQAGLLSREKLEEYLKNAPESYKTTKMF